MGQDDVAELGVSPLRVSQSTTLKACLGEHAGFGDSFIVWHAFGRRSRCGALVRVWDVDGMDNHGAVSDGRDFLLAHAAQSFSFVRSGGL